MKTGRLPPWPRAPYKPRRSPRRLASVNARILFSLVAVTLISVAAVVLLLQDDAPGVSQPGGAVALAETDQGRSTTLSPSGESAARQTMDLATEPLAPVLGETLQADHLAAVLEGRVLSPSGQAMAGATLEVFTHDEGGFQYQLQTTGLQVTSDQSGHFALVGVPTGPVLVVEARAPNAASIQVDVPGMEPGESRQMGDLVLSTGTLLVGQVRNEDGQPLPNALIEVFDTGTRGGGPNSSRPVATALCDGAGEYQVNFLSQRQYSIHASLEGYTPMTSVLAFVLGGAGPEWRQNFTLWTADQVMAGRIITAAGLGLPDVEMRLVKRQQGGLNTYFTVVTQTDERGEFLFDQVPDGLFDVTLSATDWYIDRTLRLESARTDHEIIMHPSLTVHGQLSAVAELPEQFTVTVKPDGRTGARLLKGGASTRTYRNTDPPGSFVFAGLRPGAYSFLVKAPGFAMARSQDVIMGSAQFSAQVVIPLFQGATLEGHVAFAQGGHSEFSGGRIELRGGEWDPGLAIETAFPTPPIHGLVRAIDSDAHFAMSNIPEGDYVVTVRVEGAPPLHLRDISLIEGQSLDLGLLEIRRGGRVSGLIMGMDGRPVSGALVRLSGEGYHAEVFSRADGTFLASRLPAGAYDIEVSPAGIFEALRQHATARVVVDADAESVVELTLSERMLKKRQ